ncbi:MAG TPA: hypothetical protein VFT85_06485, partial [Acidimicrobiia bacterium]|nr:hypothetical protein [Acidimicrobiia bacterium]
LASVVFTLLAVETLETEGLVSAPLVEIATWTVFLSVILHGVTARPLARRYGAMIAGSTVEQMPTTEPREDPLPRSLLTRRNSSTSRSDQVSG